MCRKGTGKKNSYGVAYYPMLMLMTYSLLPIGIEDMQIQSLTHSYISSEHAQLQQVVIMSRSTSNLQLHDYILR